MDFRYLGGAVLAAAALLACTSSYSIPDNAYPGGGNGAAGGGGNGNYGGGAGGSTGAGSTGGDDGGSSGGSGTTTAGSATGSSSSGGSTGTSGGSSGGSTTGGGNGNVLMGDPLAFPVASAGQFLPLDTTDGGPPQMEFDLASFVLNCGGGATSPPGSVLALNLYSSDAGVPLTTGTYQVRPYSPGLPYASATLTQTDGSGNTSVVATGQSGQVAWTTSFSGEASGTLSINMSSGSGTTYLTGTFVAPFCGSF